MLRRIGATSLIGRKYRTLSQGEKQTILIARGLMEEPDLLIFDEASSGLDLFARGSHLSVDSPDQTDGKGTDHSLCHPPCGGNHQIF